jgi:pimeloyl-ACP methyl ester carboxylesterase
MRVVVDEGDGPAVLLLHGQPGSASIWRSALPALRATGVRVITVDRPGYDGHPERTRGFAGNVDALVRLLDDRGIERAHLVAHSWAGGVALLAAARHPQRVQGLLLLAAVGSPLSVDLADRLLAVPALGRLAALAMAAGGSRLAAPIARTSGTPTHREGLQQVRAALDEWRRIGAWEAFRREQIALIEELPSVIAALPDVSAPVIVVQGERDGYVRPAAGRDLADRLPHSRLVRLQAGHALPIERPLAVAGLLAELVSCTAGTSPGGGS